MSATSDSTTSAETNDGKEDSSENAADELAEDKIFHLLQVQRRRDALRYLQTHGGSAEMRNISEQVAAWENDTTLAELTSNERQRVYISLYQSHLPKLDEEGVIEYDKNRGTVELTPVAEQFTSYLNACDNETTQESKDAAASDSDSEIASTDTAEWLKAYQYLSVASLAILLGAWAHISVITSIPLQQWAAGIIFLFGTLSIIQFVTNN